MKFHEEDDFSNLIGSKNKPNYLKSTFIRINKDIYRCSPLFVLFGAEPFVPIFTLLIVVCPGDTRTYI